jgi:sugar phosphate isomerase/epimerase
MLERAHAISEISVAAGLAMNHATVRETMDMAAFVEACARRGFAGISIWGDEIDRIGEDRARHAVADSGLAVLGYNRAGPLIDAADGQTALLVDAARREIERAASFGADHVMVFTGGLPVGDRNLAAHRARLDDMLAGLLEHARSCGIRLALEPLHPMLCGDRTVLTSLTEANDLCARLGHGIGVVIDVYHVWWDARLDDEIARAGRAGNIIGFHVNDWLVPTGHTLRDRGMMGDGVIDLAGIWQAVRNAGYAGPIEIEIFSDDWARRDPAIVLDTAIERCRSIFMS